MKELVKYLVDGAFYSVNCQVSEDKDDAIREMARAMLGHAHYSYDIIEQIADEMVRRERHGSTGICMGFAMPHAKTDLAHKASIGWFLLSVPIDFYALDQQPVWLVCCEVVPSREQELHLKFLTSAFNMFARDTVRQRLKQCTTKLDMRTIIFESLCD